MASPPTSSSIFHGVKEDFRYRKLIVFSNAVLAFLVASVTTDPFTGPDLWLTRPPMLCAALVCTAVGITVRAWATGYVALAVIFDERLYRNSLVTTGPYSITRNPLYLGTTLTMVSFGLVLNLPACLLLVICQTIRMLRVIDYEEREIGATFGPEYTAYLRDVPALCPTWRTLRRVPAALREKQDWVAGFAGNFGFLGFPVAYVLAFFYPSPLMVVTLGCAIQIVFEGARKLKQRKA